MRVSYDPEKRERTVEERGLDFEDAAVVFAGVTLEVEDTRKEYGEVRIICYGLLAGRIVVVGYTPRGADRHVFSMRKASTRNSPNSLRKCWRAPRSAREGGLSRKTHESN